MSSVTGWKQSLPQADMLVDVCWIIFSILLLKFCWIHLAWWDHVTLDEGSCACHVLPCLGQGNGCKKQHLMGHSVQNLGGGSNMDEHGREFMQRLSRHINHHLSICQFEFKFAFLCNFLFLVEPNRAMATEARLLYSLPKFSIQPDRGHSSGMDASWNVARNVAWNAGASWPAVVCWDEMEADVGYIWLLSQKLSSFLNN